MVIMLNILYGMLGLLARCSVTSFSVILLQGSVGVRLSAYTNLQRYVLLNTFTASQPSPSFNPLPSPTKPLQKPIALSLR